jgi:hypothetical protein
LTFDLLLFLFAFFIIILEYGFYIDGKGNRLYPNFLVEWEGSPEAFAFQYPYIIAFEQSFIEVRHIITVSKIIEPMILMVVIFYIGY